MEGGGGGHGWRYREAGSLPGPIGGPASSTRTRGLAGPGPGRAGGLRETEALDAARSSARGGMDGYVWGQPQGEEPGLGSSEGTSSAYPSGALTGWRAGWGFCLIGPHRRRERGGGRCGPKTGLGSPDPSPCPLPSPRPQPQRPCWWPTDTKSSCASPSGWRTWCVSGRKRPARGSAPTTTASPTSSSKSDRRAERLPGWRGGRGISADASPSGRGWNTRR